MESHEVLKAAVERCGVKKAAAALGVSQSLIYKWCEPPGEEGQDASGARNPLDRVAEILGATGDTAIAQWLCRRAGGFLVLDSEVKPEAVSAEFMANTQRLVHDP